jgi:hypothetical protein
VSETEKLLREAKKIMMASSARTLNKDFLQRVSDHLRHLQSQPAAESPAPTPVEVALDLPVGYWQGAFSADGGATLYEVPQESAFGRRYPNYPLYPRAQKALPCPSVDDIEVAAEALVDSCIAKGYWWHCSEESKVVYRQNAKAVLDAFLESVDE